MQTKLTNKLIFWTLLLSFVLSGCGFALRGTQSKPLSEIFSSTYLNVTGVEQQYLNAQLRRLLLSNGGVLVAKADAKIAINVSPMSVSSRQVAISSDHYLKQNENTYRMSISVYDIKNNILLGSSEVSTVSYIQLDDREVLSSQEQEDVASKAAIRDLSQKILRYLNTF